MSVYKDKEIDSKVAEEYCTNAIRTYFAKIFIFMFNKNIQSPEIDGKPNMINLWVISTDPGWREIENYLFIKRYKGLQENFKGKGVWSPLRL